MEKKKVNKKKNKKISPIIMGLIVLFGIGVFIGLMYLSGMDIQKTIHAILGLIGLVIFIVIIYIIPSVYFDDREKMMNKIKKFEILNVKNADENIRITKDNYIFKYKPAIKYKYKIPRFLANTFHMNDLYEKYSEKTGYSISFKKKLTEKDTNKIFDLIEKLEVKPNSNIVVKAKEFKKYVGKDEINEILSKYSLVRIKNKEKKEKE